MAKIAEPDLDNSQNVTFAAYSMAQESKNHQLMWPVCYLWVSLQELLCYDNRVQISVLRSVDVVDSISVVHLLSFFFKFKCGMSDYCYQCLSLMNKNY